MTFNTSAKQIFKILFISILGGFLNFVLVQFGTIIHIAPPLFFDTVIVIAILFIFGIWAAIGSMITYYLIQMGIDYFILGSSISYGFYLISGISIIFVTWLMLKKKDVKSNLNSFLYLLLIIVISSIISSFVSAIINCLLPTEEQYHTRMIFVDLLLSRLNNLPVYFLGRLPITLIDRTVTTLLGFILASIYKRIIKKVKEIYTTVFLLIFTALSTTLFFEFIIIPDNHTPFENEPYDRELTATYYALYYTFFEEDFNKEKFETNINDLKNFCSGNIYSPNITDSSKKYILEIYSDEMNYITESLNNMEKILTKNDFNKEMLCYDLFNITEGINNINAMELYNQRIVTKEYKSFFWITLPLFIIISILLIYYGWLDIKKQKQNLKESKLYLSYVIKTQEEERAKMARELHDTLAQDMRYVNLLADQIQDEKLKEEIRSHQTECINHIRFLCSDYSSPDIVSTGLISSIQNLIIDLQNRTSCEYNLTVLEDVDFSIYDNNQLLNIYRIIQEALQNIVKHANASEVSILIRRNTNPNSDRIHKLIITDDGIGIEPELLNIINSTNDVIKKADGNHFGIKSIKERVDVLNGYIKIDSVTNEGTEIVVEI